MVYNPQFNNGVYRPGARVPRNLASQLGSSLDGFYASTAGYLGAPDGRRLMEYERAASTDATVISGLEFMTLSTLACMGPYTHSDSKVRDYVEEMFWRMGGSPAQVLAEHMHSRHVGGFALGEKVLKAEDNRLWLDYIVHYQPRTVRFYPNANGMLKENEPSLISPTQLSGIYQDRINDMPVKLPMSKIFYTANKPFFNNYYGVSHVKGIYRNFRIKEAVMEMNNIALDRYGTPLPVVIVPPGETGERRQDPNNSNQTIGVTNQQLAEEAIANLSTGYGLVFTNTEGKENPVSVSMLGTQNNFGSSFLDALQYHNREIFRGLLIPQLLLQESSSGALGSGGAAAIHFEVYKLLLKQTVQSILDGFLDQVIKPMVWMNFGIKDPGAFIITAFDPESAHLLVEAHAMLIDRGFITPELDKDLDYVRGIQGLPALDATERGVVKNSYKTWWKNKGAADPVLKQSQPGRPTQT